MFGEKAIPRLIIVTPLVTILILTALITYLYMDKLNSYFTVESQRFVDEFIIVEKSRAARIEGPTILNRPARR